MAKNAPRRAKTPSAWWTGQIDVVYDHYTLGRTRSVPSSTSELTAGLLPKPTGVLVTTDLHATEVHVTVMSLAADAPLPRDAVAHVDVTVPGGGWGLKNAEGPVPGVPRPLLGPGTWTVALVKKILDDAGGIEGHTLYCRPADEAAAAFTPRPVKQPARPTSDGDLDPAPTRSASPDTRDRVPAIPGAPTRSPRPRPSSSTGKASGMSTCRSPSSSRWGKNGRSYAPGRSAPAPPSASPTGTANRSPASRVQ